MNNEKITFFFFSAVVDHILRFAVPRAGTKKKQGGSSLLDLLCFDVIRLLTKNDTINILLFNVIVLMIVCLLFRIVTPVLN